MFSRIRACLLLPLLVVFLPTSSADDNVSNCEPNAGGTGGLQSPRWLKSRVMKRLHSGFWHKDTYSLSTGSLFDLTVVDPSAPSKQYNVFLVGDSLDREIVYSACGGENEVDDYLDRNTSFCPHHWRNESFMCTREKYRVANLFVRGLLHEGSHIGFCEKGLPSTFGPALRHAAARFSAVAGVEPDLVLLKSFYWDIAKIFEGVDVIRPDEEVAYICPYINTITASLYEVRKAFPNAIIGVRTDPFWNISKNRFKREPAVVLRTAVNFIQGLRSVATEHRAVLFDFHHIFLGLTPNQYLFDDIHVKEYYSRMELSTMLHFLSMRA